MIALRIAAPPRLAETFGYEGTHRFVSFFWTPAGDEFCYDDGALMTTNGVWHAWDAFRDHEYAWPHLALYEFGNSDQEARHWLIVDRETATLHVAAVDEARRFLRDQAPVRPRVPLTAEELQYLVLSLRTAMAAAPGPTLAAIQARVKQEFRAVDVLKAWLDAAVARAPRRRCSQCGMQLIDDGRPCWHFDFKTFRFIDEAICSEGSTDNYAGCDN